jgi:hypothetical protein
LRIGLDLIDWLPRETDGPTFGLPDVTVADGVTSKPRKFSPFDVPKRVLQAERVLGQDL